MTGIGVTLGTRCTQRVCPESVQRDSPESNQIVPQVTWSESQKESRSNLNLILTTHVLCFFWGGRFGVKSNSVLKKVFRKAVPGPFRTCTLLQTRARMALAEHEVAVGTGTGACAGLSDNLKGDLVVLGYKGSNLVLRD